MKPVAGDSLHPHHARGLTKPQRVVVVLSTVAIFHRRGPGVGRTWGYKFEAHWLFSLLQNWCRRIKDRRRLPAMGASHRHRALRVTRLVLLSALLYTAVGSLSEGEAESSDARPCRPISNKCSEFAKVVVMLRWTKQVRTCVWRDENTHSIYSVLSRACVLWIAQAAVPAAMLPLIASVSVELNASITCFAPQSQFAGYYAAQELGYYTDSCLDVTLVHRESVNYSPEEEVHALNAQVAMPWAMDALRMRDQGLRLTNIAQVRPPFPPNRPCHPLGEAGRG
jgi:hypothetical protein